MGLFRYNGKSIFSVGKNGLGGDNEKATPENFDLF